MSDVLPGFGAKRTFTLDGAEIILDPANLKFTDPTLNQFFELVSGFCDYYGQKLADANRSVSRAEQLFERLYIQKFKEFREGVGGEGGKSEKTSELYAKAEAEVVKAKSAVHETVYVRDSVLNHLKALNAARDDAHNRGHFLRKELEKMNLTVYETSSQEGSSTPGVAGLAEEDTPPMQQQPHRKPYSGDGKPYQKRGSWNETDPEMEDLFEQAQKKAGG